jgi:hypothetical protein
VALPGCHLVSASGEGDTLVGFHGRVALLGVCQAGELLVGLLECDLLKDVLKGDQRHRGAAHDGGSTGF